VQSTVILYICTIRWDDRHFSHSFVVWMNAKVLGSYICCFTGYIRTFELNLIVTIKTLHIYAVLRYTAISKQFNFITNYYATYRAVADNQGRILSTSCTVLFDIEFSHKHFHVSTLFKDRTDRLWGLPSFLWNGYRGLFPREVKWQGREADYSPPTSGEVNKTWICTSNSPYTFLPLRLGKDSWTSPLHLQVHQHVTSLRWEIDINDPL
jgi:hypothetical protein